MYGSRSRHVGVHPSEWPPAEPYPGPVGHGPHHQPPPGYYQQLPYQEPPSDYFGPGGAAPYPYGSPNAALQAIVDVCSDMGLGSVPVGPPPISPLPVNQMPAPRSLSPFRAPPSDISRPLLDVRGTWPSNDNPFLSREREGQPSHPFRFIDHPDSLRRDHINPETRHHHHSLPTPAEARNGLFQRDDNQNHWDDIPPLFGHGTETRDGRSFSGNNAEREREYSSGRERGGGRAYDDYESSRRRSSRPRSPKADVHIKDRLGPTSQGRPSHHPHHRGAQRERRSSDVEIIEHRSHPQPSSQSRVFHSPPPVHHHLPPEHRPRLEDDYDDPYTVNEKLGLNIPLPPTQLPVPLFHPLGDRLGGSPDPMAHSVQSRLGPPRITEPLDRNQGLVPFNAGPRPLLSRSDTSSPLPDLRQELDSHNPMSRSTFPIPESGFPHSQSARAQHLSSSSGGVVPLFRRSPSPNRHLSTLPSRRAISPVRLPMRHSLSPTPKRRSSSPPPTKTRTRPQTPPNCPPQSLPPPPSTTKRPPQSSPPPPSTTKRPPSPHRHRSPSPSKHPPSHPLSPAKHQAPPLRHTSSSRCAQSPTSKSKSPQPRGEKSVEEELHVSQSRRSSRIISPPHSPSRTKKHSPSRHSRASPPPSRHSRRSSGRIRSPTSDSDSNRRASSPRHKSRRSRSPSPTKKGSSSRGNNVTSKSLPSSRKRPPSSRPKSPLQPPPKVKSSPNLVGGLSLHHPSSSRSITSSRSKPSAAEHRSTRTASKSVGEKPSSSSGGKKVSSDKPHDLPQRVISQGPTHPLLPSTHEHQRRRSSSSVGVPVEEPSSTRIVKIEEHAGTAESTVSRDHPLRHTQSPSTESIDVAQSKLNSVPAPVRSSFPLSLPPAPVLIRNNDSPGPSGGGICRDSVSHDHHQEASGEFNFRFGASQEHVDTASSSCSSPALSIPPLMNLNFRDRNIPHDQSLFASSVSIGIPIIPSSRSQSSTPTASAGSFVVDLETSHSKNSSDIVSLPLSKGAEDALFPPPLSPPEKNALPFSSFFDTDGPQPTVGVSDTYLTSGQKSSPRTENLDTHHDDNLDSENEGGLVIDEAFVSQEESEGSSMKDEMNREKALAIIENPPSSTAIHDIEPPSSPDCEILSVSTVDSVPSSSGQHRATASSSDRATPDSSCSSELSKSAIDILTAHRRTSTPPASQRAKKLAASVLGAHLIEKLIEGDEMGQDLLRRFFKAVVLVTERLKWKHKNNWATPIFVSYYKQVFKGFVTATLSHRENFPVELYKNELKALKKECGTCVSKWKEQLQRFILLVSTLPKEKKDLEEFVKNKKSLMRKVSVSHTSTSANIPGSGGDRPTDPCMAKLHPPATSANSPAIIQHTTSSSDRPSDPRKARPHPHAPPTPTAQHKGLYSDRPMDPRKARPHPSSPPTLSARAIRPSAFVPIINTSSPSIKVIPSSKSSDSITSLSSTKPVTVVTGQSAARIRTGEYVFKPLTTASENGSSSFAVDRSADYSLDPKPTTSEHGSQSSSLPNYESDGEIIVLDMVGGDQQDSGLPKMIGSCAEDGQSFTGEKFSMNVFLSSSKERSETSSSITNQPGPSNENRTEMMANLFKKVVSSCDNSGVKDNDHSSIKLDAVSEPKANVVAVTAPENYDATTETEDGEIISSSPSPAPSPLPDRRTPSPILPMAYEDPDKWRRLSSRKRELSRQRHRQLSHRSSGSRSSSPGTQRRGASPERLYTRRRSRYRSRSRSWSRNRMLGSRHWRSRSHDRRRRSLSRDRRSRSHDRRPHVRRHRSRSRSRGKSRSPLHKPHGQKSHYTKSTQRRANREQGERRKQSMDSEDELEILKREALASMKQTLSGHSQPSESTEQRLKSNAHGELSRKGVEDNGNAGGEADMDLCSGLSGEEGEGEVMNIVRSRAPGKVVEGGVRDEGSGGGIFDEGSSSVVGSSSRVEATFGTPVDASTEADRKQQNVVEISKEDFPADIDQATRQDLPLPSDTLGSQPHKKNVGHDVEPTNAVQAPAGRSVSAPSSVLSSGKSQTHSLGSSLPTASLTDQQLSVTKTKSPNLSSSTTNSQSSVAKTSHSSAAKMSQLSITAYKNGPPLAGAITINKTSAAVIGQFTVKSTQPTLAKTTAGKISQTPVSTKASQASVAASSQQTVAAKARQTPATLKRNQIKTNQTSSIKTTQPSVNTTSQPSSGKTSQSTVGKTSQALVVKTTQPSSSQATIIKSSQPSVVPSIATAVSKAAMDPAIKSLKKSLSCSSSRTGSKANSPCLSPTHTPSPSGSNDNSVVGGASSTDKVRHRSGSCIKVLPSDKATWDIQHFLIVSNGDVDSESESDSSSGSDEEDTPPTASPELSEISKMLLRAKAAAEESAQIEGQRRVQETASETLKLPSPPASLTTAQKKEYLELQRKLALHAKKKALGAKSKSSSQVQGRGKALQLASKLKSVQNTKEKSVIKGSQQSLLKKPVPAHVLAVKGKARSNSEPSILLMAEQRRRAESGGKDGRARNNTGPWQGKDGGGQVRGQKEEEPRRGDDVTRPQVDQEEVGNVSAEVRQRICVKEGTIQQYKSVVERGQGELTTLTHQLTDTVSEIEELELKMENLRKALKAAEISHKEAEQRRCELQDKVRNTKDTITSTNASIQQLERDIDMERERLANPHQLTSMEMDIAPATTYENISDSEATASEPPSTTACDKFADLAPGCTQTSAAYKPIIRPEYEMISDAESMKSSTSSQISLRPPPLITDPISDCDEQLPPSFIGRKPSQSFLNPPAIITEPVSDADEQELSSVDTYPLPTSQASLIPSPTCVITEQISHNKKQQMQGSTDGQILSQPSLNAPAIITEPISDSEDQQPPHSVIKCPSPFNVEMVSSAEDYANQLKDDVAVWISSGRYEVVVEAVSDAEPGTTDTLSQQACGDLLRLEHNYCSFECDTPHQEVTQCQAGTPAEASKTSVPPLIYMKPQDSTPSISDEEITSSLTTTLSDEESTSYHTTTSSQEQGDYECVIVEQSNAEVPPVLVYDTAQEAATDVTLPITLQTVPLMPKKTFRKKKERPMMKDAPMGKDKQSRKRRTSTQAKTTPAKRRRPKNIQLEKQASLPASTDVQSPLETALSRAINTALCPALSLIVSPDSYSALTRSFSLPEVAHNYNTAGTPSTSQSTSHSLQNGFSSENRVPEILTDLVTSLNTETMASTARSTSQGHAQQGGLSSGSGSTRVPAILTDLVTNLNTETMMNAGITSPPLTPSEGQRVASDSRVSGIVSNLVTYLTSETIHHAGSTVTTPTSVSGTVSAESANVVNAVSAIQQCSPLSLGTDSDMVTLTSGCEASEEYESEEEVIGKRERIDADSLFHPGTDALFTLGPDVPPLFILPRLASAGDFPLEIDPAAVSSVALDAARQGIIHAPPNSDPSSDITESELTTGEVSELSDGSSVAGERVQSMMYIAKSRPAMGSGGREEERDTTPSLEELRSSTPSEITLSSSSSSTSLQSLSTQRSSSTRRRLPSGKTLAKTIEASAKTKARDSQGAKVIRSSSVPRKSVTPKLQAKVATKQLKALKTSSKGKLPAKAAESKAKKEGGVPVGGAPQSKEKGSSKLQLQLKEHIARLEELKGHLASKSTSQTTAVTTGEASTSSSKATSSSLSTSQPASTATSNTTAATASNSQEATTSIKSTTAKLVTSKSASSTTSKPKSVKEQTALLSNQPSTSKFTLCKSLTPKPTDEQAVAGTSKDGKRTDSQTAGCARTIGYVRKTTTSVLKGGKGKCSAKASSSVGKVTTSSGAAKKGGKLTVEAAMNEIGKLLKAGKTKSGTTAVSGGLQTMSDKLDQLWQSSQQSLLEIEPHPLPIKHVPSSSAFSRSYQLAMTPSHPAVSDKFIAAVEKLNQSKKQMMSSLHHSGGAPPTHKCTAYRPYTSPLLMFQSYRLNPLYRTNEKLALHSLSHSNKIDPNRIMCRFELGGVCNDPSCTGQHFKDISLNKEELIQDLVCYAPQMAGCSVPETDGESSTTQQAVAEKKDKIASYASQMIERYSSKVSDEDLFKLTVHDVNKERAKLRTDPRAKASYISFDDREWLTNEEEDPSSLSIQHPLSLLASAPVGELAQLEGEGDREGGQWMAREEGEREMEWDSISRELMPLGREAQQPSSQKYRYFSIPEDPSSSPDSSEAPGSGDSEPVRPTAATATAVSPPLVKEVLQSLSSVRAKGEGSEAVIKILTEALQKHTTSEELWIENLRVQCSQSSAMPTQQEGGATSSAAREKDKDQLFLRAMAATNSYNVGLECVRLAESYEMKLKCIREVIKLVMKFHPKPHPLSSHQCLELIVNVCVLDQLRGRPPTDTISAIKALPYYNDVLSMLSSEDKQLLCLVYLHMTYTGSVPICLLTTPSSGPTHPARLASKEPFLIEWLRSKKVSPQECDQLHGLFEDCLVLCASDEDQSDVFSLMTSPRPSLVLSCLSLYQNLVLFEFAHGDIDKAVMLIQHLVSACPSVADLWALHARILDDSSRDWTDVLVRGTQQCPKSAELFHLAARLSLSHKSSDLATLTTSVDEAVQWLQQCIQDFYDIPSEDVDLELTIALYRKLLGQMTSYDLQLPEYAEGVDPGNLGNQLAPLWLCYCLLVELSLPASTLPSSHSEFHHSSVEEAFESAIHSVHSPHSAVQSLWMEYLIYLRSKALEEDDNLVDLDNFKSFSSSVHRCLIAVDYVRPLPYVDSDCTQSNSGVHEDYSFHNQVVDIFASVLPPTSTFVLSQLQKFHTQQPGNPVLVARLVQCALAQKPMRENLAQTALATYLANNPHCDFLWRMAGALEQRLGNIREARWIYHQAVRVSPTNADLWKDFLLLELKEASSSHKSSASSSSSLSLISILLKKAKQSGINLWQAVKDHSSLSK